MWEAFACVSGHPTAGTTRASMRFAPYSPPRVPSTLPSPTSRTIRPAIIQQSVASYLAISLSHFPLSHPKHFTLLPCHQTPRPLLLLGVHHTIVLGQSTPVACHAAHILLHKCLHRVLTRKPPQSSAPPTFKLRPLATQLAMSAFTSREDQSDLGQEVLPAYQFSVLHQATHDHHLMYLLHPTRRWRRSWPCPPSPARRTRATNGRQHCRLAACFPEPAPQTPTIATRLLSHPATQLAMSAFTSKEDQSDLWQEALPAMHAGSISSLSVSAKRASLATASCEDLTVRVWQYSPLRLVLTHYCHHVPTAVALDPWCVVWGFGALGVVRGRLQGECWRERGVVTGWLCGGGGGGGGEGC